MSCPFGKVLIKTDRPLGTDLPKKAGYRMMAAREAAKHGLTGEPMECSECPYSRTCPEVAL